MLTSPVSDTEQALFAERKPLCRQGDSAVDFTLRVNIRRMLMRRGQVKADKKGDVHGEGLGFLKQVKVNIFYHLQVVFTVLCQSM